MFRQVWFLSLAWNHTESCPSPDIAHGSCQHSDTCPLPRRPQRSHSPAHVMKQPALLSLKKKKRKSMIGEIMKWRLKKNQYKGSMKQRVGSFEKINKIDKPLTKPTKRKRRPK
jgi:hypothetical protein